MAHLKFVLENLRIEFNFENKIQEFWKLFLYFIYSSISRNDSQII